MLRLSPKEIYEDYQNKKVSKDKASELLISLIENHLELNNHLRNLCIELIGAIESKERKVFLFLENLLISDLNELVRGNAATIIIKNFSNYALEPIKWALQNEESETSLVLIIKALEKTECLKLKSLLNDVNYVKINGNIFFPYGNFQNINLSSRNVENILNIKGLGNLTNLNKLNLNFNNITEIHGLNDLSILKSLHLQGNQIRKIKGLDQLTNLEYLYLNNNDIIKIQGIRNLSKLKSLMIYDNHISEIKKLTHLSNLEILNLRNNQISEIKGLENLRNLRRLDLSNNKITEIKELDNLVNLEFLDLSYNQISEIKGLDNLKNLKFLDLRNNNIRTIKQLKILKQLQHLYLGFNRISFSEDNKTSDYKNTLDVLGIEGKKTANSPFDFFYKFRSRKNSIK
ncbi:MAG: leucine-rich repeat domain-containing protein [Promethearchaeota archaeon]|jgi:hypothetical protein